MRVRVIRWMAWREFRRVVEHRWLLVGLALLFGLGLTMWGLSIVPGGWGLTRVSISYIQLFILGLPWIVLVVGAQAIAPEAETGRLDLLWVQPVQPSEIFWGKAVGLAGVLGSFVFIGLGLIGWAVGFRGGGSAPSYGLFAAFALLLTFVLLGLGMGISTWHPTQGRAIAWALGIGLFFLLVSDLILLGIGWFLRLSASTMFLLAVLNPVQSFRLLAVSTLTHEVEFLGPAAGWAMARFGPVGFRFVLVGSLILWGMVAWLWAWWGFHTWIRRGGVNDERPMDAVGNRIRSAAGLCRAG